MCLHQIETNEIGERCRGPVRVRRGGDVGQVNESGQGVRVEEPDCPVRIVVLPGAHTAPHQFGCVVPAPEPEHPERPREIGIVADALHRASPGWRPPDWPERSSAIGSVSAGTDTVERRSAAGGPMRPLALRSPGSSTATQRRGASRAHGSWPRPRCAWSKIGDCSGAARAQGRRPLIDDGPPLPVSMAATTRTGVSRTRQSGTMNRTAVTLARTLPSTSPGTGVRCWNSSSEKRRSQPDPL